MHVSLIGDSKLTLRVSVSVHGSLSLCGPVMDWRPVQGVPCLSPNDEKITQDYLQPCLPWIATCLGGPRGAKQENQERNKMSETRMFLETQQRSRRVASKLFFLYFVQSCCVWPLMVIDKANRWVWILLLTWLFGGDGGGGLKLSNFCP